MQNGNKENTNLTDILGIYIDRWKQSKEKYREFNQQFSITTNEPLRLDESTLRKLYAQLQERADLVKDYSRSRRKLRGKISVSKKELWALLNDDMASSFKIVQQPDSSLPYVHLTQAGSTKSDKDPGIRNLIRYEGEYNKRKLINTSSSHCGGGNKKDVISRIKQLRDMNKKIYDQKTRNRAWGNIGTARTQERTLLLSKNGFELDQLLLDCRVSNTRKDADSSVKQRSMKWATDPSEGSLNKKQRKVAKDDKNFIFIEHSSVDSNLLGVNRGDESKSSRVRQAAKQPGHDRLLELAQMYSTNAVMAKSGLGVGKDRLRYYQNADLLRNDLAFNTLYDIYANPERKKGLEIEHVSSRITPVISIMLAQRMYIPVNEGCKSGKDRARMTQCMLNAANRILEHIVEKINKIDVNEVHSSGKSAQDNQENITTMFVNAMNSREFAYEFLIEFLDPVGRKIANSNCPGAYGIKNAKVPNTIMHLLPKECQEVIKAYIKFDNAFAKYNKIDKINYDLEDMGDNPYRAVETQPLALQNLMKCQTELIEILNKFLNNQQNSSNAPQSDAISRLIKSIEREMGTHGYSPGPDKGQIASASFA